MDTRERRATMLFEAIQDYVSAAIALELIVHEIDSHDNEVVSSLPGRAQARQAKAEAGQALLAAIASFEASPPIPADWERFRLAP